MTTANASTNSTNKVIKIYEEKPLIQNPDRNIKIKDYESLGANLLVTSMFRTIQGEGPFAGHPAVFLRLAGCNYGSKTSHCNWCDTSFEFDSGKEMSLDEILLAITTLPGYSIRDVLVITGGEPTLQIALLGLITRASYHFRDIQIETNGTQNAFYKRVEELGIAKLFKSVVSPKASYKAGRYAELPKYVSWYASALKFVLSADEESPHHTIPDWALDRSSRNFPVYVSPMAIYKRKYSGEVASAWDDSLIDKDATAANYNYAATYAMKHNLLLSIQVHLFIGLA